MTEKNGEKVESSKNIKAIPIERRAISMTNANFLIPKTLMNTDNASKITREEEDIVNKLADEVNYFKKQHQLLAEKLKKSEEFFLF